MGELLFKSSLVDIVWQRLNQGRVSSFVDIDVDNIWMDLAPIIPGQGNYMGLQHVPIYLSCLIFYDQID